MPAGVGLISLIIMAWLSPGQAVAAFPGNDGRIAFTAGNQIFTILPDGSGLEQLTDTRTTELDPSWSPDGRTLVFTRQPTVPSSRERRVRLFTMDAEGGNVELVAGPRTLGGNPGTPSFSPNGKRLVYTTGDAIRTIRIDGGGRQEVFEDRRGSQTAPNSLCCLSGPKYAPNGRHIVFQRGLRGKRWDGIWTIRTDGSRPRSLTDPAGDDSDFSPDYSPDGRQIVFQHQTWTPRENELFLMKPDGSRPRPIPGQPRQFSRTLISPTFAPSGDRVAGLLRVSAGLGSTGYELFTISASGHDVKPITECGHSGCDPSVRGPLSWQPVP